MTTPEPEKPEFRGPDKTQTEFLATVYGHRFPEPEIAAKDAIWKEIVHYLQRYIAPTSTVLDIGCDLGYFIHHVQAGERWATDVRDVSSSLAPEVHFVHSHGLPLLDSIPRDHFDVIFMSNYLEHLPDSEAVVAQLQVVHDLLKPGGQVIILQPNIKFIGGRYWDFIDHHTALTEASLREAAEVAQLRPVRVIARFLPYTTKSRYPQNPTLVRLYLRMPIFWRLFGEQTLLIAERDS